MGALQWCLPPPETTLEPGYHSGVASNPFDTQDPALFDVSTHAAGPVGSLPLTPEMLRERPSGDLFGWTQNAGMGWNASTLGGREFLMLSTHGGIRATGWNADRPWISHRSLGSRAADGSGGRVSSSRAGTIPFAASCTDPCDGRSQGTPAMFDSLPVSQRRGDDLPSPHPLAPDAPRRAGHRHL